MPATLTRAPNIRGLIAQYGSPAAAGPDRPKSQRPPLAVRNHAWYGHLRRADEPAHALTAARNARWEAILEELRAHPTHLAPHLVQSVPGDESPQLARTAPGQLYPTLPAFDGEGIQSLLAFFTAEDSLPRQQATPENDIAISRRSRGFQFVDLKPFSPSAPLAGRDTLQHLSN